LLPPTSWLPASTDFRPQVWLFGRQPNTITSARYRIDQAALFEADGKQLLVDLKDRLLQFGLSLHEGKTRLIEFGRFAAHERTAAGQRRPETFDFLGFTHYCAKTRKNKFMVKRKTQAKRLARKLKAIREEMKHRMHAPLREQHRWLRQVLNGSLSVLRSDLQLSITRVQGMCRQGLA